MAKKLVAPDGSSILYQGKDIFICESIGVVKEVNLDRRSMVITGTDETKDRDGDVIAMSGWELENYKKNPVFLWAHNYGSVPIARAEKVIKRRDPARMDFHLLWPTKGIYPFADMILELYGEKIINASSVGFIPFKWENLTEEEKESDENPRNQYGRKYTKQELLELSGCAVPSNPNALQNALKGFFVNRSHAPNFSLDNLIKWLGGGALIPQPEKANDIREEITKTQTEIIDETAPVQVQVPDKVSPTPPPEDKKEEVIQDSKEGEIKISPDEVIDKEEVLKPYPNEHACRLEDPGKFDRFARKNCFRKHDDKCIDFIFGIKEGKSSTQAMRYKKDVWTSAAARAHCSSHKGSFEAASSSDVSSGEEKVPEVKILVDVGDIKEIKSKLEELIQTLKSMGEPNKGTRTGPEDKGPMVPNKDAASVVLENAFIRKPQPSSDSVKELIKEVKSLRDSLKNSKS